MQYDKKLMWCDDDREYTDQELFDNIESYVKLGGKIYIGTDSMLYNKTCKFASVIAIHSKELNVGRYYYKKKTMPAKKYKELQTKIYEEVDCSINIANLIAKKYPDTEIEVHVDIGIKKRCKTKKFVEAVRGWVKSSGFVFKHKPMSWASSVADWYSK
jgi:predicted RNase H-related nuclease YkuK (DUF458 family)